MKSKCKIKKEHSITTKFRFNFIRSLTNSYGYRCWYCGIRFDDVNHSPHIDHIIPVSEGGKSIIENLALSCRWCNSHKFYYPIEEFIEWLAHIRSGRFECPSLDKWDIDPVKRDILTKDFNK